ncbi:hypothetical protein WN48_00939 [Eufriesea mexicana]|uniref:Uncharacterized protein n=1 Tax=Eufriesea mexicana TaxID=516756 RepID=A0A310SRQ5_9HYME|nr:hypothetical protein WN48_00939 [Eufriesea mexicana]
MEDKIAVNKIKGNEISTREKWKFLENMESQYGSTLFNKVKSLKQGQEIALQSKLGLFTKTFPSQYEDQSVRRVKVDEKEDEEIQRFACQECAHEACVMFLNVQTITHVIVAKVFEILSCYITFFHFLCPRKYKILDHVKIGNTENEDKGKSKWRQKGEYPEEMPHAEEYVGFVNESFGWRWKKKVEEKEEIDEGKRMSHLGLRTQYWERITEICDVAKYGKGLIVLGVLGDLDGLVFCLYGPQLKTGVIDNDTTKENDFDDDGDQNEDNDYDRLVSACEEITTSTG